MDRENKVIPRQVLFEEINKKKQEMIPRISDICSEVYGTTLQLLEDALEGKTNIYTQIDKVEIKEVINMIKTLLNDDMSIFYIFYNDFAQNNGCMTKTEDGYQRSKFETELDYNELIQYKKYLNSTELIINRRKLIAQYLKICPFPTIKTRYKDANQALHAQLKQHQKQVIQGLLPNLSDDESKIILSNNYEL